MDLHTRSATESIPAASESIPLQASLWRGETPRYAFSGHQTFPFRYAWLPKGVGAVREDPEAFLRPDALVRMGVGKNMVASIRFWCEALGLIAMRGRSGGLTPLGELLFGAVYRPTARKRAPRRAHMGADPYLEDPGTLWLLHWQLASRPHPASTWHLVFTRWGESVFTRDDLARWLLRCARASRTNRSSIQSIRRDVDVFLRTYLPARDDRRRPLEDSFDCPLAELGLIRRAGPGRYAFERGPRPSLPDAVLAFALADFWRHSAPDQETLALERILFDPGSPGAAFKLGDRDLVEVLERLPADGGMRYDETAGQRLVLRDVERNPLEFLTKYYEMDQA